METKTRENEICYKSQQVSSNILKGQFPNEFQISNFFFKY